MKHCNVLSIALRSYQIFGHCFKHLECKDMKQNFRGFSVAARQPIGACGAQIRLNLWDMRQSVRAIYEVSTWKRSIAIKLHCSRSQLLLFIAYNCTEQAGNMCRNAMHLLACLTYMSAYNYHAQAEVANHITNRQIGNDSDHKLPALAATEILPDFYNVNSTKVTG